MPILPLWIHTNRYHSKGVLWPSDRVLDSEPRGCGFEPYRRYCVVSLSKTHLSLLNNGSTQENPSRHSWKIVDWGIKNQIKQTSKIYHSTSYLMLSRRNNFCLFKHLWDSRRLAQHSATISKVQGSNFNSDVCPSIRHASSPLCISITV